jgi:periplasmic protein TonB
MSGRAEMSPPIQDQEPQLNASGGMKVALIGPNEMHRKTVAKALAGSEARSVREFVDYPASLSDLPQILDQHYDVIMIDVDSDQSYALKLVESIAGMTSGIVMVYSKRNDPDLLMNCMQAGARDFLPLPSEPEAESGPGPHLVHQETRPAAPVEQLRSYEPPARPAEPPAYVPPVRPVEPTAYDAASVDIPPATSNGFSHTPAADSQVSHSLQQDIDAWDQAHLRAPEPPHVRKDPVPIPPPVLPVEPLSAKEPQPIQSVVPFQAPVKEAESQPQAAAQTDSGLNPPTFDEWDSAFLRKPQPSSGKIMGSSPRATVPAIPRPQPPAAPKVPEVDPRTAATAEILAKVEAQPASPVPVDTSVMSATRPKVERPALEPLFTYETPEEEKIPNRKWMIWAGAGAAIVIVAALLIVFLEPFKHTAPAAAQQQVVVQQEAPVEEAAAPAVTQTVPATNAAKPSAAVPAPNAVANSQVAPAQTAPAQPQVSSGMMDAQLAAPSRISKDVKTPAPVEEAPPSGFSPSAMESSGSIPGAAFAGQNKVQVVAGMHAISSGVAEGMLIRKIEPIYPKFAKDSRITGTVVLKATITKSGGIEGLQVLSGPKILSEAALNAVKFWRYRPYMLNNEPVEVQTTINVVLNLSNNQ